MIKKVIIDSEKRRLEKMFGEGNVLVVDSSVDTIYLVAISISEFTFNGQANYEDADKGEPCAYGFAIGEDGLKKLYDKL